MAAPSAPFDVVIIGAGFAGAATAWALAQRGIDHVLVVEREDAVGRHASGKNAGLGRQLADDDATTAVTTAAVRWLTARPALFTATGSVLSFDDALVAERYQAQAERHGVAHQRVDEAELRRRWPTLPRPPATTALVVPGDGIIDAGALLGFFLAAVPPDRCWTDARVLGARPDGDAVSVTTSRGEVRARLVVNAAGAWAGALGDLLGAHTPALRAIKRHVYLATVPVAPAQPFVWHLGSNAAYARPHPAGMLLSACDGRLADADDVAVEPALEPHRVARFAAWATLASAPITSSWACARTFGPGDQPVVAVDTALPWLVWVAGLGGHGVTASAAVGERAAALIAERLAPT